MRTMAGWIAVACLMSVVQVGAQERAGSQVGAGSPVVREAGGAAGAAVAGSAAVVRAAGAEEEQSARKVLVLSMTKGFRHASIPTGQKMLKEMAEESKAFTAVVSDDLGNFEPERIKEYAAVVFLNTTGELPMNDAQKSALMERIKSGELGFVGIHSATDTFYQWEEYGKMIGGYFDGHPWNANKTVTIRREKENAITQPFPAEFDLTEEIYQMKNFDRSACDVCLSLNTEKTDMSVKGIKRTDGDFPVSWIKQHGEGRIFYTSMGHNDAVYERDDYQAHVLAGLRWVMGDIEIPVRPHHLPESK